MLFDKKRTRVKHCPCGKSNKDGKFVPYIGFNDKGYCHSCGKTFIPDKNSLPEQPNAYLYKKHKGQGVFKPPVTKYIPYNTHSFNLVTQSCKNYEQNNFAVYLNTLFGEKITTQLLQHYYIGTSKHWQGATVFWQIDGANRVRAGKTMLYHSPTGKRVKQPYSHIAWVHSVLKLNGFKLQQCFFGEHLLKTDIQKPIAIVESEKTAIIASVYLPQFIWLATGSLSNLTKEKCEVLRGRRVVLFPDANGFKLWSDKAKELSPITPFTVSDMLEKNTTAIEKINGLDMADYFSMPR